jgi:hypothetical protein
MTFNQIITLFSDWAGNHLQIKTFGNGEEWEKEGILKPGILYPMFYTIPTTSQTFENTKQRSFKVICFAQVKKDKTNEQEVLSDTEQIIDDFIKYLRYEDEDFNLIGEPVMTPFKEDFGDWCAGWETEIIIETVFNNNSCDGPED